MQPDVFDVDAGKVSHGHLIYVQSRNLYAKVTGRRSTASASGSGGRPSARPPG